MINVYFVPSKKITREYHLIEQGLRNNVRINMVDNEKDSDFVFLFYTSLNRHPEYATKFDPKKTIFIDYHDKSDVVFDVKCKAYFKRSWVEGGAGIKRSKKWPLHYYPISFAIMDEFLIDDEPERSFTLTCTIRPHVRHVNRPIVLNFIKRMKIDGVTQRGEFNTGSMNRFNDNEMKEYFRLMKRSRLVVTCNPSRWEGDHRTWEAFASGALVFVDRMFVPMIHPLIHYVHCIIYDVTDYGLKELGKQIHYFVENRGHANAITKNGFEYAMKYHRSSNRIDDIFTMIERGY